MNIRDKQELIDRFNAGEMEGAERIEFIRLMENDPALAEDVKLSKKMDDFYSKNMERVEMLEKLNSIYYKLKAEGKFSKESDVQKKNRRNFHIKWYHVAASIIILLGISFILCLMLRPPKNERLYAQYFKPYDGTYMTRGGEEHPKPKDTFQLALDKYHLALDEYNDGNYEKSWKMFKELPVVGPFKMEMVLYKGISVMEINKYDDAIHAFQYIIKDNSTLLVEEAKWYLTLCYLKTSNMTEAKKTLTHIVSSNAFHKKEAEEILKSLNE
jgi:tetratricopeptide (TPR) repeat protein